ncbi:peptidyl-prolyl cis-trans isomerase CYP26-2, chloroplastic isoform X2 [Phalaenopsis equestris]|uniref:peptidyl-prolyl cis-trans isomerase CYP26-2, chloroplastic isoform X2 n=1 Tax=Phalaenopsis equestris TaxID=78828 RepID=UPI0009E22081|nr:peptidyl-prolyl cis-trans isomerase CYP26-2, chloroplastic isoform X2 [Phalaenopsis equestris]
MKTLIPAIPSAPQPLLPSSQPPPPSPLSPIISRRLALNLTLSLSFPSLPFPPLSSALLSPCPSSATITSESFLDISIAGTPAGRITIGLFADAFPAAAARFAALASGSRGLSFRRKEFVKITPTFIQLAGVQSFGIDADLVAEWAAEADRCAGLRSTAGTVGIVVRNPAISAPAMRIVARNGRIEVVEEEEGEVGTNGTEIMIATRESPEMDERAVTVGRVVEGMEVVEKIAGVSKVRDNAGSPYFSDENRMAKLIGDKRAVVAERGFNRPFVKVEYEKLDLNRG